MLRCYILARPKVVNSGGMEFYDREHNTWVPCPLPSCLFLTYGYAKVVRDDVCPTAEIRSVELKMGAVNL